MSPSLHPTAIVHPGALLAANVVVGPYCVVEDGVELGEGVVLEGHAVVRTGSKLGRGVRVASFAVIGGPPQDLRFDPAVKSGVRVGERTVIREGVTIHRATVAGGETTVGADALLMAQSHVAHDAVVEDRVVLANNVMLGGHSRVGAGAFVGGGAGIHQHTRVGRGAMVGALSLVSEDVPPFGLVAERNRLAGLNLVGLKRSNLPRPEILELKLCWRTVYSGGSPRLKAEKAKAEGLGQTDSARLFLDFFLTGKRGFTRPKRGTPEG